MKKTSIFLLTTFLLSACSPTVKLQAPEKPIEINLNVKIEQHVKISIDKDVKQAISTNKDIF
ncbi:MAG: YnbE family lipoprotein [Alphaproteobacteria bacterium]|nr:YnbE family lipoprotein [Alphaproteobacteria bacterium]MCK5555827.1 YnbE family lipoprotein [Alphaproteobacteria bacterium]